LGLIDAWWKAFADRADEIEASFQRGRKMDLVSFMRNALQAVDDRLCWEYGPAIHKPGHRLVITPEAQHELHPLVRAILARAPQLPRWEFYAHRLPEDAGSAVATVKGRVGVDFAGSKVKVQQTEDSRLGLEFHSPACRHPEDQKSIGAGFVAAETLLGEDILNTWIGPVRTVPLRKPGFFSRSKEDSTLLPMEKLKDEVDARIAAWRAKLPDHPRYLMEREGPTATWTSFELKPPERDDYPWRSDLFVAITGCRDLWVEAHGRGVFSSRRHSRFEETFCYLKIENSGIDRDRFPERGAIEDALDADLRPAETGGSIGGGTGRRYCYVDLALTDVNGAIPIIRRVLRAGKMPQRSWLLFFDEELSAEWVGVWDETPPPPAPAGDSRA
jgi:hypothetical protein